MRPLLLLPLLLFPLALHAEEQAHVRLAREFLFAHRRGDEARMTMLAARPAKAVAYALSVYLLLDDGETAAAEKLARLRSGPEREGLQRLIETYRAGLRPDPAQVRAVAEARRRLARKEGALALHALEGAGRPAEGTLLAAEIHLARAQALELEGKPLEAARAYADCAAAARAIGWLQRARDAQRRRLELLRRDGPPAEALAAAEALVGTARALEDAATLVWAHAQRWRLHLALGDEKAARAALVEAVERAKQAGDFAKAAALLGQLGMHFFERLGQPKQAHRFLAEALDIYRKTDGMRSANARKCLLNLALVESALARYEDALRRLDELLRRKALEPALRHAALTQRAYVLRRLGRYEQSLEAFEQALASTDDESARLALNAELGELQLLRHDLREARRHFDAVLKVRPKDARALAGRAAARLDEEASRRDFAAALKAAGPDLALRRRILLQRAGFERSWGRLEAARRTVKEVLQGLDKAEPGEYLNLAVAYEVLADLLLVDRDYEQAAKILAQASVFFHKLQQAARAIPAYARETLVLVALGRRTEAEQRLVTLQGMAAATEDPRLRAIAKRAEAWFRAREGRTEEAVALLNDAFDLAAKADDVEGQATALVHRAVLQPQQGVRLVRRALALLDARPEVSPQAPPLVECEHPLYAASVGVRSLLETHGTAEEAFPLLERARIERLQLALGGRERLLVRTLDPALHRRWVAARGRLAEARRLGRGVEEARAQFDAVVFAIREAAPRVAAVAFPRTPPLEELRAALGEGEALLLALHDEYAQAALFLDRTRAELLAFDPAKPLDGLPLEGTRRLLVVPDGALALGETELDVRYSASAAWWLATAGGEGTLRFEGPVRLDLSHPRASTSPLGRRFDAALVVVPETVLVKGPHPVVDAVAAFVAALQIGGADRVLLPLGRALPEEARKGEIPRGLPGVVLWD